METVEVENPAVKRAWASKKLLQGRNIPAGFFFLGPVHFGGLRRKKLHRTAEHSLGWQVLIFGLQLFAERDCLPSVPTHRQHVKRSQQETQGLRKRAPMVFVSGLLFKFHVCVFVFGRATFCGGPADIRGLSDRSFSCG